MTPNEAAKALSDLLNLPAGAANVLIWYDTDPPSLRVWVEERYLWLARDKAPGQLDGYTVKVEARPEIKALAAN